MAQLQKGARVILDQLLADLAALDGARGDLVRLLRDLLDEVPLRVLRGNPDLAADVLDEMRQVIGALGDQLDADAASMRRRIMEDLTPMLMRSAQRREDESLASAFAALQQQVADLERRVGHMQRRRVIPFRREG